MPESGRRHCSASFGSGSALNRPNRSGAPAAASRTAAGITYMPLGEIVREHLGLLESDPPETVRRRLGQHDDPRHDAWAGGACRPASARCARAAAPGVGRLPRRARGRATRGRADRGPALGRGRPPRPARSWIARRSRPAARCWQPRVRSSSRPADVGRRGRDADTLWLEALPRRTPPAWSTS